MDVDEAQQAADTSEVLLASMDCELNVLRGFLRFAIVAFSFALDDFVTVTAAYFLVSAGSKNVWLHVELSICSSRHANSDFRQVHIREFLPVFSCQR